MSYPSVILEDMEGQLRLVEAEQAPAGRARAVPKARPAVGPRAWEIDDHTREVGRRGVASARQALRQAVSRTAA